MSANDMKLHGEEIYAAVLEWYLGPNSGQRVFMCVCVRGCASAYFFFLHMGVIWSFVIPCLHTHTLLVFLCFVVFLFVWTKCTLARARTCLVVVFALSSSPAFSQSVALTDFRHATYSMVMSPGKTSLSRVWSSVTSCLWLTSRPVLPGRVWLQLKRQMSLRSEAVSIVDWGGTEVNWGHSWS